VVTWTASWVGRAAASAGETFSSSSSRITVA
jgi:hypothetical protein